MYSKHKQKLSSRQDCEPQSGILQEALCPVNDSDLGSPVDNNDSSHHHGHIDDGAAVPLPSAASLAAAQFILKTRDGKKLTQTALDGIIKDTIGFVEHSVEILHDLLRHDWKG